MKRFYIALLLLSLCSISSAQAFFCTEEGTVCTYVRTEVRSGRTRWVHTMSFDEVTRLPDGTTAVSYSSSFADGRGKSLLSGKVPMEASISPEGDVSINLTDAMRAVAGSIFPKSEPRTEGECTVLPAGMRPGDTLPDASARFTAGVLKYDVSVTEREVVRHETLNTPAGQFDCTVVREHKVEKAGLYSRITTAFTWYCRGIGMVRHDTYDKAMVLETSEVLTSLSSR